MGQDNVGHAIPVHVGISPTFCRFGMADEVFFPSGAGILRVFIPRDSVRLPCGGDNVRRAIMIHVHHELRAIGHKLDFA